MKPLGSLVEALIGQPETRREFRQNPAGVARRFGAELDADTHAALSSFDWDSDSSELVHKINKGCMVSR